MEIETLPIQTLTGKQQVLQRLQQTIMATKIQLILMNMVRQ